MQPRDIEHRNAASVAFVGRELEMADLLDGLENATAGRGRLFVVVGEPGIGKTRLAAQLAEAAEEQGARVLWGRSWEAGGAPAFWPWVQSLRSYVRGTPAEVVRRQLGSGGTSLVRILPELSELLPDLPPGSDAVDIDTAAEAARFRLFDDAARFLRHVAEERPLVLILDDLHAADEPSHLLLEFVGRELLDSRILIVALAREIDQGHPVEAILEPLRHPGARSIRLSGLAQTEVALVIESVTGHRPPDAIVSTIHMETEGNPLFIGEIARLLAAEGQLDVLRGVAPMRITIPPRIREVVARRLRRLPEECIRILTTAAVLGREFDLESLYQASGVSRDELLAILEPAVIEGVLVEMPTVRGGMRFSHALVRDALYDALTPRRREQLHQEVGEGLERLYADDLEPHLAQLAYHFIEAASEKNKAADYARRAGDRAVRLLAYEEAIRLYELALQALTGIADASLRCDLLLALGDAEARAGDATAARDTFLSAADLARKQNMSDRLARAALGYGGRFVWARAWGDVHVLPLLQEALAALPKEDSGLRVRVLARLAAGPLRDTLPVEARESMSQHALDMARRLGDPTTLAYALDGRHCANMGPESVESRLSIAQELIRVSEAAGDSERAFEGHDYRLHALLEACDLRAARQEFRTLTRLANELGQPAQRWFGAVNGAKLALFEGRYADAEDAMREATEQGRLVQNANTQLAFDLQTYALRREQARLAEVVPVLERAVAEFPAYPVLPYVLADALAQLERESDARTAFDELAADGFLLYLEMQWLFGISLAAEVCGYLGDGERASTLYELLVPYERHNATLPPELCRGSVSRELGILAATMSRWDAAVRHFKDAVETNSRMGARPWVAYAQHDYARALLNRDEPGDRERSADLLADVLDTCQALGLAALQRRASVLARMVRPEAATPDDVGTRAPEPSRLQNVFRRQGEYWSIRFEGTTSRLKDSKGLRYLARLLANPGREFAALELVSAGVGSPFVPGAGALRDEAGLRARGSGDAGPILDDRAKTEYRRRLAELEAELAEAETWANAERASRTRAEIDFLERELAAALGLRGRDRIVSSDAERARVNVTKAIRSAMARIREHDPSLGGHLSNTVRTGMLCSYAPDPRVPASWQV